MDFNMSLALVCQPQQQETSVHPVAKKKGRPFENPQETSVHPVAKKKGRPFKTHEAAAAAAARGSSTDQQPKKRGRPFTYPQNPGEVAAAVPPEPIFIPFICEWKNCPAELHNLDTLKAHLITVHLKKQASAGLLMCLWGKCCQEHMLVDDDGVSEVINKGAEFKTTEEWRNHAKVHLDHVARYQGDGPKTELSFYKKPPPAIPYSYRNGGPEGQATPSVRHQPVEGGRAKHNNLARFRQTRDGLYFVLEPVHNPELYMKVENDQGEGYKADMDES
ncbi:hypothetical protein D0Z07_1808 [Hyphodiscus hymeniophilus]|uniref:C2H2-type domain-containing protein n=1 Tax=Hyphodiscus hymeniophilus TaxID=353542 RepID=A0A9P6VNJ3_9HELO|nr:hypothetical protein D0Z07_1808 [Hyphodiscus hymeniophilus]